MPEQLECTLRDLDWLIYVMSKVYVVVCTHSKACTSALNLLISGATHSQVMLPELILPPPPEDELPCGGALMRVFKQVQRIKISPEFIRSIGLRLGTMGNLLAAASPVRTCDMKSRRLHHFLSSVLNVGRSHRGCYAVGCYCFHSSTWPSFSRRVFSLV